METLLVTAVVLITLAVIAQAGVLIAMYLLSRRISEKAEALMDDSRKFLAPMEIITNNLKIVAADLAETSKIARDQALHVQNMVGETRESVRENLAEVRDTVLDAVDEARSMLLRPIREYTAIATGIAEGIRTFLYRRQRPVETETRPEEKFPAA
jgi:flagellar basal body-associated protein FliL